MSRLKLWLETIKISHSVFALPFALMGAFLAAGGPPGWRVAGWTVLAAVAVRTAAMTFRSQARCQCSSSRFMKPPGPPAPPTLFTRMSTRPKVANTPSTTLRTPSAVAGP